jgi:hypothetical protein
MGIVMSNQIRALLVLLTLVAFAVPGEALAQGRGNFKVFFGFGYLGTTLEQGDQTIFTDDKVSNWGLHGDFAYGLSDSVALVLDGSFPNGSARFDAALVSGGVDLSQAIYMVGPRLNFGTGSFKPSVQALAGIATSSADRVQIDGIDSPIAAGLNETSFAGAIDVNLDLQVSNSIAIRLVQAGLVFSTFGGKSQAAPRFSFGVVAGF